MNTETTADEREALAHPLCPKRDVMWQNCFVLGWQVRAAKKPADLEATIKSDNTQTLINVLAAKQEQQELLKEALNVLKEIAPHMLSYCNGHQVPPGSLSDELHMISDIITKLQAALGEV